LNRRSGRLQRARVELSHRGEECSFETWLRHPDDPVIWEIARTVHEADFADGRYDAAPSGMPLLGREPA